MSSTRHQIAFIDVVLAINGVRIQIASDSLARKRLSCELHWYGGTGDESHAQFRWLVITPDAVSTHDNVDDAINEYNEL